MLKTKRCLLNQLQQADYEDVKKLYVNEAVRKYLGGTFEEHLIQEGFVKMIHRSVDSLYLVAREKETKEFIGVISLDIHHDGKSKEVSYQLLPKWWGAGYATELVKEMIHYAFNELNLNVVVAETQTANVASCRLLEKLGMELKETVQRFGAEQAIYRIKN